MHSLICRSEKVFDKSINYLSKIHPYILMFLLITVMPLDVLVCIGVITIGIMLPISLLFGWI